MTTDVERQISGSRLRLRMKSPFFATLSLFTEILTTRELDTAGTDGQTIYVNPQYLLSLSASQQDALLLHEVLHAALLHVPRRQARDPRIWNIAADIVVNGMITEHGEFELPSGALQDSTLEQLSVEEIYDLLLKQGNEHRLNLTLVDLLSRPPIDRDAQTQPDQGSSGPKHYAQLEAHWRNALQHAAIVARTSQGSLPAGIQRHLDQISQPQLDWRSYLWRYLVQTPTDFQGFDRRFIGQGLYLESLSGESVQVFVAVDTSGSIDLQQMRMFLGEVNGILGAYHHLDCQLYFADADVYGPYALEAGQEIPTPIGGGGTSFVPFFARVEQEQDPFRQAVCVYLTDGYGTFPTVPPTQPVLWVVAPGGLRLERFPFGEAVRLL